MDDQNTPLCVGLSSLQEKIFVSCPFLYTIAFPKPFALSTKTKSKYEEVNPKFMHYASIG